MSVNQQTNRIIMTEDNKENEHVSDSIPAKKRNIKAILSLLLLGITALLFLLALFFFIFDETMNDPAKSHAFGILIMLASMICLVVWFLIFSKRKLKVKLIALAIVLGIGVTLFFTLEIRGWYGGLIPDVRLKGSKSKPDPLDNLLGDKNGSLEGPSSLQFRANAARDGIYEGDELDPDWAANPPKELWRIKIGEGLGGFAIQGNFTVLSEKRDDDIYIVCYDTKTGQPRWFYKDSSVINHSFNIGGEGPRSTPCIEDGKLYDMGVSGSLICLDLKTGKKIWQESIYKYIGVDAEGDKDNISWGRSGSPLIYKDFVIVPGGGNGDKTTSLLAFDRLTGELKWRGGSEQASYASPQVLKLNEIEQIVIVNESSVSGHNPDNGDVLWEIKHKGRSTSNANASQVVQVSSNGIIVSKGYGKGSKLFELSKVGDQWTSKEVWHQRSNLRTKFSSAVFTDEGNVIGLSESYLQCVDSKTGEEIWKGESYGYGQVIRRGKHILVLSEKGKLAIVSAKTGEELGKIEALKGKTWSTPALAGNLIFLRNSSELVCYELK